MKQHSLWGSIWRAALIGPALIWAGYLIVVLLILLFQRNPPTFDNSLIEAAGVFIIYLYGGSVVVSLLGALAVGLPCHFWAARRGLIRLSNYLVCGAVGSLAFTTPLVMLTYATQEHIIILSLLAVILVGAIFGALVAGAFWFFYVRPRLAYNQN